jgi:hypothetical protein
MLVASSAHCTLPPASHTHTHTQAKKRTEFVTEEDIDDLTARPPVVTVMGHVDHGVFTAVHIQADLVVVHRLSQEILCTMLGSSVASSHCLGKEPCSRHQPAEPSVA